MVYEPREDSLLLEKWVERLVYGRVLDVGTGTGILARAALEKGCSVVAVDIDHDAVAAAREMGVAAVWSDLFSAVQGEFDWIVCNPPYLPEDPEEPEDSRLATTGGREGGEFVQRLLQAAKGFLREHGAVLLLVSSLSGDVERLFQGYSFELLEECPLFMESLFVFVLRPLPQKEKFF